MDHPTPAHLTVTDVVSAIQMDDARPDGGSSARRGAHDSLQITDNDFHTLPDSDLILVDDVLIALLLDEEQDELDKDNSNASNDIAQEFDLDPAILAVSHLVMNSPTDIGKPSLIYPPIRRRRAPATLDHDRMETRGMAVSASIEKAPDTGDRVQSFKRVCEDVMPSAKKFDFLEAKRKKRF